MEKNIKNFIEMFNPRIVSLDLFNKEEDIKINYKLLIIDDCFIVDKKIRIKKLKVKTITTSSHQSKRSTKLDYREDFLKKLGLKNEFGQQKIVRNKQSIEISDEKLEMINNYLNNESNFNEDITFRDFEYLINGSNPSGEPKRGSGFFFTKYDNKNTNLGVFLSSINKINEFKESNYLKPLTYKNEEKLKDIHISDINDVCKEISNEIEFEDWIKNYCPLKKYFEQLTNAKIDWKQIKKQIENSTLETWKKFKSIEKLVQKNRYTLQAIVEKLKSKNNLYCKYFNLNNWKGDFEIAHIKPVSLIKKQFYEDDNYNVLNQISDVNNFLPLPPNIHNDYDKFYFYWDEKGNFKPLKEEKLSNDIEHFKHINEDILCLIEKYLIDYQEYLTQKNLI